MLKYDEMVLWTRNFEQIEHSIGIINELFGCRYHHANGNPCKLDYSRGTYVVMFCGCECVTFGVYDLASSDRARDWVCNFSDSCWLLSRSGKLVKFS